MIISETSLCFLGLGLRPPAIRWGVLLQEAPERPDAGRLALAAAARPCRSSSRSWRSTSWATACATRPTRTASRRRHDGRRRCSRSATCKTYFFADEGTVKAVDGVELRRLPGPDARHRRRERLRQERHRALDPAHRRAPGPDRRRRDPAASATPTARARRPRSSSTAERRARCARSAAARSRYVFQEPMTSFSPVHTIGNQIIEAIRLHQPVEQARGARPRRSSCCGGSASRAPSSASTSTPSS